uniref:Uncharacterized protein n=1 Tax=Daphnia galeata TaxID=27404 RepID=A0A8J2WGV4_9CRUS|nr:unnamed protein product [Daphnia galeata]
MISRPKDTVVFVVMAQPLVEFFLPMRIALSEFTYDIYFRPHTITFGTEEVCNLNPYKRSGWRLKRTEDDGQTLETSIVPQNKRESKWFAVELLGSMILVQYVVHNEGAKWRTRFLKITKKSYIDNANRFTL